MIDDPEDPDYYFDRDRQVGIKIRYEQKLKKERIERQEEQKRKRELEEQK